jgi:hypothetical protein
MACVPHGSVLGLVSYLLYINDVPNSSTSNIATIEDDTAVMTIGENVDISTRKQQSAVNKVAMWKRKGRIKFNESKSVNIDFTDKKIRQLRNFINGTKVPYANTAKYFVMILDAKLGGKSIVNKT